MLPDGLSLTAEFWEDKDDHSQGTHQRAVRMVRLIHDHTKQPRLVPVGFKPDDECQDGYAVKLMNTSDYSNFKQFSI